MDDYEILIDYLLNEGNHLCIRKQAYKVNIWICKDNINTKASRCKNCELGEQMIKVVNVVDNIRRGIL
jgi:hypothetical protein